MKKPPKFAKLSKINIWPKKSMKEEIAQKIYSIVNLEEINLRDVITNTDIILTIIEIALNKAFYNISATNKSINYWKNVSSLQTYKNILSKLKTETLKKYWIIINQKCDVKKFVEVILEYKQFLDSLKQQLKYLSI